MVVEIAERALGVVHVDAVGRAQGDPRGEALADHAEADDEVGGDQDPSGLIRRGFARPDARGDAPRQEFGIAVDPGDELEELLGTIWQEALFGVGRHGSKGSERSLSLVESGPLQRGHAQGTLARRSRKC